VTKPRLVSFLGVVVQVFTVYFGCYLDLVSQYRSKAVGWKEETSSDFRRLSPQIQVKGMCSNNASNVLMMYCVSVASYILMYCIWYTVGTIQSLLKVLLNTTQLTNLVVGSWTFYRQF